jgi:hypothetical protein
VGDRRDPRIRTNTRATVWFGSRAAPFTIDNLSLGGARLVGSMVLRLGQHIDIEFNLDSGPVKVTGEVVRVDTPDLIEDQIAVRFLELQPEVRIAIRDTVMRQLADHEIDEESKTGTHLEGKLVDPVQGKLGDDDDVEFSLEEDT